MRRSPAALCFTLLLSGLALAGERYALVIGIDGYYRLGKLKTCVADAEAIHGVLVKRAGFPADKVILMTDKAAEVQNQPLLTNLRDRVRQVTRFPQAGDTLFLYYSGHGDRVLDDKGNKTGYLIPIDGNTQLNAKGEMENAIPFSWLRERIEECKATTKVVVLDTCHAGSATKGVGGITGSLASAVLLLSCKEGQISYADDASGHSVFSQFLILGLAGAADQNKDKDIAVSELASYVESEMGQWVLRTGKDQDPVIDCPKAMRQLSLAKVLVGSPIDLSPVTQTPSPKPPQVSAAEAIRKALASADLDEKIRWYTVAINVDPGNADSYCRRGMAYHCSNQPALAYQDFAKAIALEPKSPAPYLWRGIAYADRGRHDLAIADYSEAIRLDAGNPEGYARRAWSYCCRDAFAQARADAEKCRQLGGTVPDRVSVYLKAMDVIDKLKRHRPSE